MIEVEVPEPLLAYADMLIEFGAYGESRPEVLGYLIQRGIDDLLRSHLGEVMLAERGDPGRPVPPHGSGP